MNKLTKGMLCGVAVLGVVVSGKALAGYKQPAPLSLSKTYGGVSGGLGDIRASGDTVAYLECDVVGGPSAGPAFAECYGQDSSANFFDCWSSDPGVMAAAQSVNGDSWVEIQWNTSTGVIQYIDVANGSEYRPKSL